MDSAEGHIGVLWLPKKQMHGFSRQLYYLSAMMTFEVENMLPVLTTKFEKIERGLRDLKSYGKRSFASLTREDGSYLQVAGGGQTCILELRMTSDDTHLRAYLVPPRVPFEGGQTILFGGGQLTARPDEILGVDGIVEIFRAFLRAWICRRG